MQLAANQPEKTSPPSVSYAMNELRDTERASRFTICSNAECSYCQDLKVSRGWNPRAQPEPCPLCKSPLIFHCWACFWSLHERPDVLNPKCARCGASLRPHVRRKSGQTS